MEGNPIIESQLRDIYKKYGVPQAVAEQAIKVHQELPQASKEVREDNALLTVAFVTLSAIQYRKEGSYGRSFCKRGDKDIFFNTARKFDRIENIVLNNAKDEVGESTIDTVGDLANYGLLWMTYYMRENKEAFAEWLKNN